jgi:hypothetical protein
MATPEEILQMMKDAGMPGANYATRPITPGPGEQVTEQWVLDALAQGQTQLSTLPMDGPEQEAETLAALNMHPGVARVNANTSETGIRAVTDEAGNITLTNLTDEGKQIQKGGTSYNKDGTAVGLPTEGQVQINNTVHGILDLMKRTTDVNALRGLSGQLNEAMAAEQAKLYAQAQSHAATTLGIPELEQQLGFLQSLERRQPSWMPGMPESPQTLAVRQRLEQARGLADAEAKRYLAGNITANSLNAAAKTAETEVARITRLADQAAAREDRQAHSESQVRLSRQLTREAREDERQEKLRLQAQALTPQQKDVARVIFQKPDATDEELALTIGSTKDKSTLEVLNAEEGQLPFLAITGNAKAAALVEAKEQQAGVSPEVTKARIRELNRIMNDPTLLQDGINERMKGAPKEQRQAILTELTTKSTLGTPEEKRAAAINKYELARAKLQQGITTMFLNDVNQWGIVDPRFQEAVTRAKEITGSTDVNSVLMEYKGSIAEFKQLAATAASRNSKSALGAIDPVVVANQVEQIALQNKFNNIRKQGSLSYRFNDIYRELTK